MSRSNVFNHTLIYRMVLREGLCVVVVLLMTQVLTEDVDCSLGDSTSSCKICINGTRSGKVSLVFYDVTVRRFEQLLVNVH